MKILFTGKFDPDYNRTKVIINGLRAQNIEVQLFPFKKHSKPDIPKLKSAIDETDWIFMPSFTHTDLPFIKRISNKPIIFDPLISRYLSKVFDYKAVWKYSPRAYKNFLKDKRSLRRSDLILADTELHKQYYINKFGISPDKIKVVPIGVISKDFYPQKRTNQGTKLIIGFYGSFIPLHGIDIIISAAKELSQHPHIEFRLIGDGILFEKMKNKADLLKLKNIVFSGWKSYSSLNEEINNFDIALGIFGSSIKAKMVIPNKLFHYSACNKASITMKSDAISEIFSEGKNIELCLPTGHSLAKSILKLENKELRTQIGQSAGKLINDEYNEKKIASLILDFMNNINKG